MSAKPAAGSTEDAAVRRQQLKEKMQAFYGTASTSANRQRPSLASGTTASSPSPVPETPPSMQMNSEFFNVQQYTTHLLQNETLEGLVETDTRLLRDVRRLDKDLQELVYRNYAKFISATDTIREMRRHVSEMDQRLSALKTHADNMEKTSQQLFQALEPHRVKVEESITTNRKLKKAFFIKKLPETLQDLLRSQNYSECVQYWVMGDAFFEKHLSSREKDELDEAERRDLVASLSPLRSACWEVTDALYKKMEDEIASMPLDDPAAMDSIHRLVENLRLVRATSAFAGSRSDRESDISFDESIRLVLMRSVQANFARDIDAVKFSLQEALMQPSAAASDTLETAWRQPESPRGTSYRYLPALAAMLSSLPLLQRHTPMEQLSMREPLAQLKSACALLAANSTRIHHLILLQAGSGDSASSTEESAKAHIAEHIQPALTDILTPLKQYLVSWLFTYIDGLLMSGIMSASKESAGKSADNKDDLLFVIHEPRRTHEMLEHCATALFRQLKQLSTTLKTLGEMYLNTPLRPRQSEGYAALVDQCVVDVLLAVPTLIREHIVSASPPATVVHAVSRMTSSVSLTALLAIPCPKEVPVGRSVRSAPGGAAVLDGGAEGESTSRLLSAANTNSIAVGSPCLHYVIACLGVASLMSCLRQHVQSSVSATHPPEGSASVALHFSDGGSGVSPCLAELDLVLGLLVHRVIMVEGQYSTARLVGPIFGAAVPPSTTSSVSREEEADYFMNPFPSSTAPGGGGNATSLSLFMEGAPALHPAVYSVVVVEWTFLYRLLCHLTIHFSVAGFRPLQHPSMGAPGSGIGGGGGPGSLISGAHGTGTGSTGSTGGGSSAAVRLNLPTHVSSSTRASGNPNFSGMAENTMIRRNRPSKHLVVEYQRKEQTSLQHNIDAIFLQQSALLETRPRDGKPTSVLKCIVLYVLRSLLDRMRRVGKQYREGEESGRGGGGFSFSLLQLHCTFLLHTLLDPAPPLPPPPGSAISDASWITSTREWASPAMWGESLAKTIQHEIDELCMCGYERAVDPVVPLAQQNMESVIREGVESYVMEMSRKLAASRGEVLEKSESRPQAEGDSDDENPPSPQAP